MGDPRVDKLANMLVNYSVQIKPGEKVAITGDTAAEPLIKAVYQHILQAGGFPFTLLNLNGMDEIFYKYASDDQLRHIPPAQELLINTYDARIACYAETNTRALSSVDPSRMAIFDQARRGLMDTMMRRSASGDYKWTLTIFPTNACAQDADMSLEEYEDFVYGACMPDQDDPIGYWQQFSAWQDKIIHWLDGKKEVRVYAHNTDLKINIEGRKFINCDGRNNVPDGEVFTGPVENGVDGTVHFSFPAIYDGREVTGVRLWFEKGKVVKATADKNEEFLISKLDTDEGARRVGEFAFGTNEGITKFTRQILFDEKIGGSFHMALGAGYPETGSLNKSAIHWDMVCDLRNGGQVWVDNQLFYQNGKYVIDF
ncbi:MAG: aminopeptidase [Dehalococcoidales bacterium]|jgi:aminopeptidase|nr:aminopeptidase [Dehalococcoidales bacterium]NLE90735.1 aminopeptidase [Dehalococcoidales bacterium]